jgi:hypothetical protein
VSWCSWCFVGAVRRPCSRFSLSTPFDYPSLIARLVSLKPSVDRVLRGRGAVLAYCRTREPVCGVCRGRGVEPGPDLLPLAAYRPRACVACHRHELNGASTTRPDATRTRAEGRTSNPTHALVATPMRDRREHDQHSSTIYSGLFQS